MSQETLTIKGTPNTIKSLRKLMVALKVAVQEGGGISLHTYLPDDSGIVDIEVEGMTDEELNEAFEFLEGIYTADVTTDMDFQGSVFSLSGTKEATITIEETE